MRTRKMCTSPLVSTSPLVHKHLIVRAEVSNPPTQEDVISDALKELVDKIGMKLLMGPYAKYVNVVGNRGLTAVCIIETSHIVIHTWDECSPPVVQLDVYTCGALDINIVFDWLQRYSPTKIDYKYIDRENGIVEVPV